MLLLSTGALCGDTSAHVFGILCGTDHPRSALYLMFLFISYFECHIVANLLQQKLGCAHIPQLSHFII